MSTWTIKGQGEDETAKALDNASRTFADLKVRNAKLTFRSLGVDVFSWRASMEDYSGGGTIIPDIGQRVELYRDGVRKFRGHVTSTKILGNDIQVEVSGPWWWLKNTPLTSIRKDGKLSDGERVQFVFQGTKANEYAHNLAASIKALVTRAIDLRCPLAMGKVSEMFEVPRITLSQMSCADALAELLRWCPDATTAFQYSGNLPILHIMRRGAAIALADNAGKVTLNLGSSNIETIEINPRLDLKVDRVELKHVTRDSTTGKPKWGQQSYPEGSGGMRQIITISGPEIADFLPNDDFDSYAIKTMASAADFALKTDPTVAAYRQSKGEPNLSVGNNTQIRLATGRRIDNPDSGNVPRTVTVYFEAPKFTRKNGNALNISNRHFVTTDTPPDWVAKTEGISLREGTLSGTIYKKMEIQNVGGTPLWVNDSPEMMEYVSSLGLTEVLIGWDDFTNGPRKYRVFARKFEIPAFVVSIDYSTRTVLRKPWEYTYLTPPANLAENLRKAQNWLPWEGRITTVADTVSAANILNKVVNVTGALAPAATMNAMISEVTHEIERGRTHITLGAPPRFDFGGLVSRVRRDPQDNIVYL